MVVLEHLFERLHRLAGAVTRAARRRTAGRPIAVEPHRELRSRPQSPWTQRGKRHRVTRRRSSHRTGRRFLGRPEFPIGLYIDLPDASESVEVVDHHPAHEGLHSLVHVAEIDSCFNAFSRSTLAKSCGALGIKVVLILSISGRLRAASMKVCVC